MNDVVVGVNDTETARAAAHTAAALAAAFDAELRLVMCAERHSPVAGGVGSDRVVTDWVADAEQFLKDLARTLPHDEITWTVSTGDPADSILAEAERRDAGTIVVGNVRTHGLARVLGSVASDVIKKAPCDVLIAHTT